MPQKVIVIGAGIIGAATAYHLQKSGAQVTVLDAGGPSATGASFGWINASFYLNKDHFHLRADAIEAYRALSQELDVPISWCGCVCFETQGAAFDAQAKALSALGYAFDVIDAAAFAQIVPNFAKPPERSLMFRQEAAVDATQMAHHLLMAAQARGAQVLRGVAVTGFTSAGESVTGVQTHAGAMAADQVVCAAGTATDKLMAQVGVNVPLLRRPAVMLKSKPVAPFLQHVLVSEIGEVRQLDDGSLLMPAAASHQSDASEALTAPINDIADAALTRLQALFPTIPLSWEEAVLAHRPVPQDALPVVGAAAEGLYVAVMHSGVTLGALMGRDIATEVLAGPSNVTAKRLASYRPDRFAQ